jgi:RNA polymerase sigma factor (TIGR02999 family)
MQGALKTDLNTLIQAIRDGDGDALGKLYECLFPDLRRIAHARLRDGVAPAALNTTALVNESYERFAGTAELNVNNRAHFLAYASKVMHSIIVDYAREHFAQSRGGGAAHIALTTGLGEQLGNDERPEVLQVHDALNELEHIEPRLARVVEMRYYGGMNNGEIAEALNIGLRSVERDWERARSFLYASLKADGAA